MASRTTTPLGLPAGMTPSQYEFCLNYLANGYNATAAYKAAHPSCTSDASARVEGHRNLTKPHIRDWLLKHMTDRWKPLQMDGDEALARVALDARADPRLMFDTKGKALNPQHWPDELANSIEGVEVRGDGGIRVKLASKTLARRTILEQTGKLKAAPPPPQWSLDPATLGRLSDAELEQALKHAEAVHKILGGGPAPAQALHHANKVQELLAGKKPEP